MTPWRKMWPLDLKTSGSHPPQVKQRVARVLCEVGIEELAHHSPLQLSGGQKQLVAIAGILAMEPAYLILDEPTAMLDPPSKRRVRNLVKRLHQARGCAVLWITQDMEELHLASRGFGAQRRAYKTGRSAGKALGKPGIPPPARP